MQGYSEVRLRLMDGCPSLDVGVPIAEPESGDRHQWESMWSAAAGCLLYWLDAGNLDKFESGFRAIGAALSECDAIGREVGIALLFEDVPRRAIAAGFDRTRFVEWLGPAEILEAPSGRIRGRVLYYNDAKGRGKLLGADRIVYFVHFSAIRGVGYRSLRGGQLIEFTPLYGVINERTGWMARDLAALSDTAGQELGSSAQ